MTTTTTEDTYTFTLDEKTVEVFKTLIADALRQQTFDTSDELTTKFDLEDFADELTPNMPLTATRSMLRRLLDEVTSKRPNMTDVELNEYGMKLIRIFYNDKNL
ncbi:hypothetical protein F0P96_06260 [Hymenobacter busanensis]|uniref:Uncharacterized protein n=1 Tax=Hymenobacter busanensis TaxID=2607656 RepID=A0A7L5A0S5_9BACT|nr:hypothetical protein [Hymenobacter busanensis]KAA9338432.1 hypothetical protein F0P96_06260 [Hymenobacter busanensis]QHJ09141.1 hypothetical protein GUY19_18345 [Hymenobacter busanensis]